MAILEGKFIKNVGQVATLQMTQKWFLWLTRHHESLTREAQPQRVMFYLNGRSNFSICTTQ